jgi:hypothetical protein
MEDSTPQYVVHQTIVLQATILLLSVVVILLQVNIQPSGVETSTPQVDVLEWLRGVFRTRQVPLIAPFSEVILIPLVVSSVP